jgi:hypothetical protein
MSAPEAPPGATPAEVEFSEDPLARGLIRADVVDEAYAKVITLLEKQVRPHLTQAEFGEVVTRLKKELSGDPITEMQY